MTREQRAIQDAIVKRVSRAPVGHDALVTSLGRLYAWTDVEDQIKALRDAGKIACTNGTWHLLGARPVFGGGR